MRSNLFDHFTETLSVLITKESLSITRLFNHMLKDLECAWRALPEDFSVGTVRNRLFMSVVKDMAGEFKSEDTRMNPEETAIKIIRHGIPKENISAKSTYLTARLPNADYRLYRETSGSPAGTIRITWKGCIVYISSGLSSEDTARFVLLLDEHLPRIDEAAGALFGELLQKYRNKQKEMMALEIARKAVDAQLANILPGMGIKVKYKIADGKVKLHLTRTFTGEVELPLEALRDFLSNPGRVESVLKPEPVSLEPAKDPDFPHPFPPTIFRSNIVLNPQ
ncbi:MAG: hypothetical protein ACI3ZH_05760 [Candidatus Cryptobacteroides sp.]